MQKAIEDRRLWVSDLGDGHYKNPVLFADYSDPDVVLVGDTYYMTASSFNYTPALPILVSKDLVNWTLKTYALENIQEPGYEKPAHARGVWAPSIRYHNSEFWICYGMPDEGIYLMHAKDILGPWKGPHQILKGKGYIDSCPFWDEDGKAYIIHGYANSRIGFKSILGMFEMDNEGTKAIGPDHFIFDGTKTQVTIEGPKVYKREGKYYIFAPAGGVKYGWQTVLKSENIHGPYEEKIVMHQGTSPINGPHQGGWVQDVEGNDWFIHFQDKGAYGRIVHLQPMQWEGEWPIIGINPDENKCGQPCLTYQKPAISLKERPSKLYLEASDDFDTDSLGLQWQWLGNHEASFYHLDSKQATLSLYALNRTEEQEPILWESSNVLTQKLVCPQFEATVFCDVKHLKNKEKAGMVLMGGQYAYVALQKEDENYWLIYVESEEEGDKRTEKLIEKIRFTSSHHRIQWVIQLGQDEKMKTMTVSLGYRKNGEESPIWFRENYIPTDHTWVGAKIGLFALGQGHQEKSGYAKFQQMRVESRG